MIQGSVKSFMTARSMRRMHYSKKTDKQITNTGGKNVFIRKKRFEREKFTTTS